MKRAFAIILAIILLIISTGCEQEIGLLLLSSPTDLPTLITLTEQDAATHILITDTESEFYGLLSPYLGRYTTSDSDVYACYDGYFPSAGALRVVRTASGSDLTLSDSLWLRPMESSKLRISPSYDSETAELLSSEKVYSVSAVSFTDALYYKPDGTNGYVSCDSSELSFIRAELEFYACAHRYSPIGAQITIIDNGVITASYAYGYADIDSGTEMNTDTKIRVASLSKVLFAIAALKLQNEGAVDIDKNIGSYWIRSDAVNTAYPDENITLRSIMTHTSSMKELSSYPDATRLKELICDADFYSHSEKPGSKNAWRYNNFAVGVGGSTLEMAAGRTMQDYVRKTVFKPLSIEASYGNPLLISPLPVATLYNSDGTPSRTKEEESAEYSKTPGDNSRFFAGGLYISSADYAKLLLMLINDGVYGSERILPSSSVEEMEKVYFNARESGCDFSQCLILRNRELYGRNLFYHTGNAYGTIAMASYDPKSGDGVVIAATGLDAEKNSNGTYDFCDSLSELIYTEFI